MIRASRRLGSGRVRAGWLLGLVAALTTACEQAPDTTFVFERSPEETVALLIDHVSEQRFEEVLSVVVEDQHALLTVAEEPDPAIVAAMLQRGEESAAANFWSAFLEELARPPTDLRIVRATPVTVAGVDFMVVDLEFPGEQVLRPIVLRRVPGTTWEVDLIASFAPAVARRLATSIESLAVSEEPKAIEVLAAWKEQRASLMAAVVIKPIPGAFDEPLSRLADALARVTTTVP